MCSEQYENTIGVAKYNNVILVHGSLNRNTTISLSFRDYFWITIELLSRSEMCV